MTVLIKYSNASNARRAARAMMGQNAEEPTDFMITVQTDGRYTWEVNPLAARPGKATRFFNRYGFWPEHNPKRAQSLGHQVEG